MRNTNPIKHNTNKQTDRHTYKTTHLNLKVNSPTYTHTNTSLQAGCVPLCPTSIHKRCDYYDDDYDDRDDGPGVIDSSAPDDDNADDDDDWGRAQHILTLTNFELLRSCNECVCVLLFISHRRVLVVVVGCLELLYYISYYIILCPYKWLLLILLILSHSSSSSFACSLT